MWKSAEPARFGGGISSQNNFYELIVKSDLLANSLPL